MSDIHIIKWQAPEYEHKEQNIDWFWGLGVVIFAGSIASILYKNYFFAAIIILGGILLGYFTHKKPKILNFEINNKGLKVEQNLYPFENIKAYYIQKEDKPVLFLKSTRPMLPILHIPVDLGHSESIKNVMISKNIPEEKMEDVMVDKIMEYFGFQ